MFGNAEFKTGQDNSPRGVRGGMVHKMKGIGTRQGPLSSLRKLLGWRRANAIETRGTSKAKRDACIMVCDFSDRRKTCYEQLSPIAKVYADVPVIVL